MINWSIESRDNGIWLHNWNSGNQLSATAVQRSALSLKLEIGVFLKTNSFCSYHILRKRQTMWRPSMVRVANVSKLHIDMYVCAHHIDRDAWAYANRQFPVNIWTSCRKVHIMPNGYQQVCHWNATLQGKTRSTLRTQTSTVPSLISVKNSS